MFTGYRGYERAGKRPLFPFGFGLSYTTFKYSNLTIKPVIVKPERSASAEVRYEVSFEVKNTGGRAGADVAQVYVADTHARVERPPRELKGFVKVQLRPGETKRVSVVLDARAFSYYDASARQWRAEPGEFDILVGRSVEEIELRDKLRLENALTAK